MLAGYIIVFSTSCTKTDKDAISPTYSSMGGGGTNPNPNGNPEKKQVFPIFEDQSSNLQEKQ